MSWGASRRPSSCSSAIARAISDIPEDQIWLTTLTLFAEVAARVGDGRSAAVLYAQLRPWSDMIATNGATVGGAVSRYLALLAATLGRDDDLDEHFAAAEQAHERLDAPIYLARTRMEWAGALLSRGRPGDADRARPLLEQAVASARELGAAPVQARAEGLLAGAAGVRR